MRGAMSRDQRVEGDTDGVGSNPPSDIKCGHGGRWPDWDRLLAQAVHRAIMAMIGFMVLVVWTWRGVIPGSHRCVMTTSTAM